MRWVVAVLAATVFAGCTGSELEPERPTFQWQGFDLRTTPVEPFEQAGTNHVGYAGELFGLYAEREDAMPRHAIVGPDGIYTSDFLRGWTQHGSMGDVPGSRSWRLEAWDVRHLVEDADQYNGSAFSGTLEVRGQQRSYSVTADPWGMTGDFDPETPYTLIPEAVTLPFDLRVPPARTPSEIAGPQSESRENHVQVIRWLQSYVQQNAGNVPDDVTAASLFLQRLGTSWPTNPFDGEPLADLDASGHFFWEKCGPSDAVYIGYGWDASPLGQSFGQGC